MALKAEQQIDGALSYLTKRMPMIIEAHDQLGIPLEDLLCAAIRKSFSIRAIECRDQLELFQGKPI